MDRSGLIMSVRFFSTTSIVKSFYDLNEFVFEFGCQMHGRRQSFMVCLTEESKQASSESSGKKDENKNKTVLSFISLFMIYCMLISGPKYA